MAAEMRYLQELVSGEQKLDEEELAQTTSKTGMAPLSSGDVNGEEAPRLTDVHSPAAVQAQVLHLVRGLSPDALGDLIDQIQEHKEKLEHSLRTPCGLFERLPAELRNKIYLLVFEDAITSYKTRTAMFAALMKKKYGRPLQLGLTTTCRQIAQEMQYLLKNKVVAITVRERTSGRFESIDIDALTTKIKDARFNDAQPVEDAAEAEALANELSVWPHSYNMTGTAVFCSELSIAPMTWFVNFD